MTPERAAELADDLRFKYAMSNAARDAIQQAILAACKEQKEADARLMEKMSGQISELTQEFDSSRAEGAFNALVNAAAAIRSAE